ncbi:MAG: 16S rRNA (cytidine(1402)-2'-O)-methyltransferase [Candidatus Caenarcaniphilales bacterium]|jgi:16S rRNA (cytidine1402-2'-O)-methyltransferase|nr:16S rRNA (cytidine(1402)-2'-O)-methyltransferase [Candidatus Caenarcaniphilales bacterium]
MSILYLVASPIGNLEDISFRALKTLESVPVIFCEDTRVSQKLLNHYQIKDKRLISFNQENERKREREILALLDEGNDLAILSDAGTPLISDPGASIVKAIYQSAHQLISIPGASALTVALSLCPFDTSRFTYEGFLPHGPKQRRRILKKLINEERAIVIFESPHRIIKTLIDIENILPEREIFLARELSKKFESKYYGSAHTVRERLIEEFPKDILGEIVLLIGPKPCTEGNIDPTD